MSARSINITNNTTLREIETSLQSLAGKMPVHIKLSRNSDKNFFKDSWLTSLITNAALSSGGHLTIQDWSTANVQEMTNRFASSLVGILAAYLADELENSK